MLEMREMLVEYQQDGICRIPYFVEKSKIFFLIITRILYLNFT